MNDDLVKSLMNPIFKESDNKQNKDEYFEDDFTSIKRANRIFTAKQKEICWQRAKLVPGRDPNRWRFDATGNLVVKALKGCEGPLCHEYDHIIPFSKGGETVIRNCQILQTYTNKIKSNKIIEPEHLKASSKKIQLSETQMDVIEEAIYGDVRRFFI